MHLAGSDESDGYEKSSMSCSTGDILICLPKSRHSRGMNYLSKVRKIRSHETDNRRENVGSSLKIQATLCRPPLIWQSTGVDSLTLV